MKSVFADINLFPFQLLESTVFCATLINMSLFCAECCGKAWHSFGLLRLSRLTSCSAVLMLPAVLVPYLFSVWNWMSQSTHEGINACMMYFIRLIFKEVFNFGTSPLPFLVSCNSYSYWRWIPSSSSSSKPHKTPPSLCFGHTRRIPATDFIDFAQPGAVLL